MAKYQVGQEFQHKWVLEKGNIDSVWFRILYVCPIDGHGVQYYVTEVLSGYNDGARKKFINLTKEENIDRNFDIRDRPFNWK